MHPQIKQLIIVQNRDQRLLALRKDLERVPRDEIAAQASLKATQQAVTAASELLKQAELAVQKVELDIATRRTTVQRLKHQQFETRKNDEYTALGNEVLRYLAEIDDLETAQLELMERVDSQRQQLNAEQARMQRANTSVAAELAILAEKRSNLEAAVAEVAAERDGLISSVDHEISVVYEKLLRNKNGIAVVGVTGSQCGGCHMKLISATLVKVQAGLELAHCENCGRMLFFEG